MQLEINESGQRLIGDDGEVIEFVGLSLGAFTTSWSTVQPRLEVELHNLRDETLACLAKVRDALPFMALVVNHEPPNLHHF